MRINQNVMANNASRNLASTNVMLGKNLEKLSSGFRINRAADDAAGLVVGSTVDAEAGRQLLEVLAQHDVRAGKVA